MTDTPSKIDYEFLERYRNQCDINSRVAMNIGLMNTSESYEQRAASLHVALICNECAVRADLLLGSNRTTRCAHMPRNVEELAIGNIVTFVSVSDVTPAERATLLTLTRELVGGECPEMAETILAIENEAIDAVDLAIKKAQLAALHILDKTGN